MADSCTSVYALTKDCAMWTQPKLREVWSQKNVLPNWPTKMSYKNRGGVTGGYAIPHFRNFSALFPQIRRRKLAISAILWDYEQSLPTSYKTQLKPFSFHFARDRSDSSSLLSKEGFEDQDGGGTRRS